MSYFYFLIITYNSLRMQNNENPCNKNVDQIFLFFYLLALDNIIFCCNFSKNKIWSNIYYYNYLYMNTYIKL